MKRRQNMSLIQKNLISNRNWKRSVTNWNPNVYWMQSVDHWLELFWSVCLITVLPTFMVLFLCPMFQWILEISFSKANRSKESGWQVIFGIRVWFRNIWLLMRSRNISKLLSKQMLVLVSSFQKLMMLWFITKLICQKESVYW